MAKLYLRSNVPIICATLWLASVFSGIACSENDPCEGRDLREFRSEHFVYETCLDQSVVAPEVTTTLESHLRVMSQYLGLDPQSGNYPIRYLQYPVSDRNEKAFFSADANEIHGGPVAVYSHELIHAYLAPIGTPVTLLSEGVATALGCDIESTLGESRDWRELMNFEISTRDYESVRSDFRYAAAFVSYLLSHFDRQHFIRLYASTPRDITILDFATLFASIYGMPIEQAWAQSLQEGGSCLPIWPCSQAPIATYPAKIGAEPTSNGERVLQVHGDFGLQLQLVGSALRPLACTHPFALDKRNNGPFFGQLPFLSNDSNDGRARDVWAQIPAGTYALTHMALFGGYNFFLEQTQVNAVIEPNEAWISESCDVVKPIAIASDRETYVVVPSSTQPRFLRINATKGQLFWVENSVGGGSAISCTSCDTSTCISSPDPIDLETFPIIRVRETAFPGYTSFRLMPASASVKQTSQLKRENSK